MIRLGLFSDVHYCSDEVMTSTRMCSLSYDKLCEAYKQFEKEKVDLIICLGDLADVGKIHGRNDSVACMNKIISITKKSKIPFLFITGNHDSLSANMDDLEKIIGDKLAPRLYETPDYRFICLDANYDSSMNHFSPNGFDWTDSNLPQGQIDFLKESLASSNKECIILIHEPLDSKTQDCYRVNNASEIREIIEKSGKVKLVLQGHKHYHDDYNENNIRYLSVIGMCEGKENHFVICDYDSNTLKIRVFDGDEIVEK